MLKKNLKKLVETSYEKNGQLNEETVSTIADNLSRKDLKKYINALRLKERKSTVLVKTAVQLSENELQELSKNYENKKIEQIVDPTLLVGVEVIDNDMVYNRNLKHNLDTFAVHVSENS